MTKKKSEKQDAMVVIPPGSLGMVTKETGSAILKEAGKRIHEDKKNFVIDRVRNIIEQRQSSMAALEIIQDEIGLYTAQLDAIEGGRFNINEHNGVIFFHDQELNRA